MPYNILHITKNIITAFCLMMFFISCNTHKNKEPILYMYNGKFPDESAENMCITMSDSGKISFIVETPLMNRYYGDSAYTDCPKGVKIVSYNEHGLKQAILTADYACEIRAISYKASKNVVIIDVIKGDTLQTEEITWDKNARTITCNTLVKQSKADGSVNYGDGFTADDRFTKYTIIHPRGVISGFEF